MKKNQSLNFWMTERSSMWIESKFDIEYICTSVYM